MTVLNDEMRNAVKALLTAPPTSRTDAAARDYVFRAHKSDALGVHPSQIQDATAEARKHGCMVDFTPDGRAIVTSAKQYKQLAKSFGAWNGRDGFQDEKRPTGDGVQRQRQEMLRKIERGEIKFD